MSKLREIEGGFESALWKTHVVEIETGMESRGGRAGRLTTCVRE